MNHMEDEIKRRLENANSLQGIDPDELWEDIDKALPGSPMSEGKNRRIFFGWWFFGAVLTCLVASIFIWENKGGNKNLETGGKEVANFSNSVFQKNKKDIQLKEKKANQIVSKKIPPSGAGENNVLDKKYGHPELLKNISDVNPKLSSVFILNENEKRVSDAGQNNLNTEGSNLPKIMNEVAEGDNKLEFISENKWRYVPMLPLRFLEKENIGLNLKRTEENRPDDFFEPIEPMNNKRWRIGVMFGGNILTTHFKGQGVSPNFSETLNNSHRGELGNSVTIQAEWKWNEQVHLSTGLEYFNTRTSFDIVQEWDTVMWRDNLPGGELIDARAVRTVIHHNRQDYLAVPVMVGISKKMGRFRGGVAGGMALNFFISQKGKSLNAEGQIATIGEAALPFRKTFLSFQVNPHVNYRMTRGLEIRLQSILRWQPHGQSEFYGLRQNAFLAGLRMGVFIEI